MINQPDRRDDHGPRQGRGARLLRQQARAGGRPGLQAGRLPLADRARPGRRGTEISLEQPGSPLHDEATAEQLRELITKGAMIGLVFQTDDARALYETLKARGVTDFTQEPTDHFYGTDMGIRDPFGNAIRILQPAKVAQEATA